jgi:hypothetical protein
MGRRAAFQQLDSIFDAEILKLKRGGAILFF